MKLVLSKGGDTATLERVKDVARDEDGLITILRSDMGSALDTTYVEELWSECWQIDHVTPGASLPEMHVRKDRTDTIREEPPR